MAMITYTNIGFGILMLTVGMTAYESIMIGLFHSDECNLVEFWLAQCDGSYKFRMVVNLIGFVVATIMLALGLVLDGRTSKR